MLYKRHGPPEEGEIVLCQVTKIYPNSVFVNLLEYNNLYGIVHISEISPGRIRNLRDFVSLDRQIVCKILRIDRQTGNIDLSLRRVNSTERMGKMEEIKQELKAESLIKNLAKKRNTSLEQLYQQISDKILKEYPYIYLCFSDVVEAKVDLLKLGLPKDLAEDITSAVIEKFKPKKIVLNAEITLHTYDSNGIEKIKNFLHSVEKISPTINLFYLGAGKYKVVVEDFDYKPAEETFLKIQKAVEKFQDKLSEAAVVREKSE